MAKILVIDDSMVVRMQVSRALKAAGFSTVEAADGVEALDHVRAHPDLSLAICDINMPKMNGLEFLTSLGELSSSIPVIMLTTEGQPAMIQQAKALGAKGWLIKPCNFDHLVAAAKKLAA